MAQAMGVPEGTLIMAGSSDGCLAQLGSGAVEPGHAALTIGTSGAIRVMAPQPADDPAGRIFSYVLTPEHYVCGGAMNNGGVSLQWFSKAFLPWSDYNDFLKTAFTAPAGSDGLLCLPYMLGERAPCGTAEHPALSWACGSIIPRRTSSGRWWKGSVSTFSASAKPWKA